MSLLDKVHNLSLRILTLCGIGALISLGVNIITALVMFASSKNERDQ